MSGVRTEFQSVSARRCTLLPLDVKPVCTISRNRHIFLPRYRPCFAKLIDWSRYWSSNSNTLISDRLVSGRTSRPIPAPVDQLRETGAVPRQEYVAIARD